MEALPGIQASRIEWGAAVQGTARELLREPEDETEENPGQQGLGGELGNAFARRHRPQFLAQAGPGAPVCRDGRDRRRVFL